jgi:hypothetical protein
VPGNTGFGTFRSSEAKRPKPATNGQLSGAHWELRHEPGRSGEVNNKDCDGHIKAVQLGSRQGLPGVAVCANPEEGM